jgi:hypothetical protein
VGEVLLGAASLHLAATAIKCVREGAMARRKTRRTKKFFAPCFAFSRLRVRI